MRKALFFGVAYGFLCAGFAWGADFYSVEGVAGQAHRLGSAGQWIAVSEGDVLSPATIIRIGSNAALVVKNGDTEQTLRSARQGALESFLGTGATGTEGRISVGGRAMDSTVPSTLSRPPVRAPVQDRELDWAE